MAVQAAQLIARAVEIEAVGAELGGAETELPAVRIENLAVFQEIGRDFIELRRFRAPWRNRHREAQLHPLARRHAPEPPPLQKLLDLTAIRLAGEGDLALERVKTVAVQKYVVKMCRLLNRELHAAADAAEGHIVHHEAEGWLVERFAAIDAQSDAVLGPIAHEAGKLRRERRVAAVVARDLPAVDIERRRVRRAVHREQQRLALPFARYRQREAIAHFHLVKLLVEIVQRQLLAGVRQAHLLPSAVVKLRLYHFRVKIRAKPPRIVQILRFGQSAASIRRFPNSPIWVYYTPFSRRASTDEATKRSGTFCLFCQKCLP